MFTGSPEVIHSTKSEEMVCQTTEALEDRAFIQRIAHPNSKRDNHLRDFVKREK